ncbi:MAG: DUF493 domain-containing protein [Epsilonproteobacteria bacterium]|nr:DUF493 domain-containing protein [Campylobacterota bacterium]
MDNQQIQYPCEWEFCVFGEDKDKIKEAIDECIPNQISQAHSKSHKNYHSHKVKVMVNSEDERNELYKRLKDHPQVKYIL